MSPALVRTNLGKWGANTQTFYEHGVAVHVFRTVFNFPASLMVANHAKRCGMGQDLLRDYENLVFLESLYHDYDKLYMPEEMVRSVEAMKRFEGHGDVDIPRNREALEKLVNDLESGVEDHMLPTDLLSFLRRINADVIKEVLKAVNASHEGMRLPEKVEMVERALKYFFEQVGCPLSDPSHLARAHLLSLRAADSVASAWEGDPSFKSDVTEVVELIRSFQQLVGEPSIHVTAISLNPAIFEARPPSVVSSFLKLYDMIRRFVDGRMIRYSIDGLSVLRGSVIEDNSSLIVAIWLGNSRDGLQLDDLVGIPEEVLDDLVTLRHWEIELVKAKADFDAKLRETLLDALYSGFRPKVEANGIPCYSCGRPTARVYGSKELREGGVNPQDFQGEIISFEKSSQLGYLRAISPYVYGVEERFSHNDYPLCPTCMWLFSRGMPVKGTPVTFILYGMRRSIDTKEPPCTSEMDHLVEKIFSYYLRELVLARLWTVLSTEHARRYGLSVMVSNLSTRGEALLQELLDILRRVSDELRDWKVRLPCGEVRYEFEWALRVGSGPISPGYVWDHVLMRGVWEVEEYHSRLDWASKAISYLRDMGLRPKEVAHKLEGGRARIGAVLLKEMEGRIPRKIKLEKFVEAVSFLKTGPGDMRLIREVVSRDERARSLVL